MYLNLEESVWLFTITFLPLKEGHLSHSVPDRDFVVILLLILFHLELSRIDLPKLTSTILMEIVTVPVVLVDEFCFYMHHPIKAWLFEKIIFELVYLFHIVLKSLVSY